MRVRKSLLTPNTVPDVEILSLEDLEPLGLPNLAEIGKIREIAQAQNQRQLPVLCRPVLPLRTRQGIVLFSHH